MTCPKFLFKLPNWPLPLTSFHVWLSLYLICAYTFIFFESNLPFWLSESLFITMMVAAIPLAYWYLKSIPKIAQLLSIILGLILWIFFFQSLGESVVASESYPLSDQIIMFGLLTASLVLMMTVPVRLGVMRLPFLKAIATQPAQKLHRLFRSTAFLFILLLGLALVTLMQYTWQLQARLSHIESVLGETLRCDEAAVISEVSQTIVRVVGGESEGSGVIIDPQGLILTNFHVIQFEPAPKVVFNDYSFEQAEIILTDKNTDLAILKINRSNLPFMKPDTPAASNLAPLQPVIAFGFPFGTDIAGGVTIQRGGFVSLRTLDNVKMIHTDITLNKGFSGGALTDRCGHFIGVNTQGVAGIAFAISAPQIYDTWAKLQFIEDPLEDVQKIDFKPFVSPVETVKAFYNYQKVRQLEKAYALLSPIELTKDPYEDWVIGYDRVIDVELVMVQDDPKVENRVQIKLVSKDLVGQEVVYKFFEGWWDTVLDTGSYYLGKHRIIEIEEPGSQWWYDNQ
jgi:serine protease Do